MLYLKFFVFQRICLSRFGETYVSLLQICNEYCKYLMLANAVSMLVFVSILQKIETVILTNVLKIILEYRP